MVKDLLGDSYDVARVTPRRKVRKLVELDNELRVELRGVLETVDRDVLLCQRLL